MKVLYVKCSSTRIKKFQLQTTIYEYAGQKFVKKEALCVEAIPHLMRMKDNYKKLSQSILNTKIHIAKIISETKKSLTFEFIDGVSMEESWSEARKNNLDEADDIILSYVNLVKNGFKTGTFLSDSMGKEYTKVFGEGNPTQLDSLKCFEKTSNCDLIPQNIIVKDDIFYIIDYEWVFDFPVSVEYIYFRGLYLFQDAALLANNIDSDLLEEFYRAEKYFTLEYVLNKESFFQVQHYYLKNKIDILEELVLKEKEIENRDQIIQIKDQEIQNRDQTIMYLNKTAQSMRIKNRIKSLFPTRFMAYIERKTTK